ncbi:hypothetical protein F5B20DRAFT_580921 [Whalleya microplaca]|nr:hypothetical protein F5B20DRAFT_580921 [Whalleya microplaca]
MSQLPAGTLGDAVGVLIYTFICLFSSILLIWLQWVSRERLCYVALIAYFSLLCTISSIVQQIYNYVLWDDLMWAQLYYIKANFQNADVVFNNGNFGFMLVMANIRLFCYIMESSYLLGYTIQITFAVYGYWPARRRAERTFLLASKIVPLLLAGITIGLLQTRPVQSSFLVYMIVANAQSVFSCGISIVLIFVILWKYIDTKRFWRHVGTARKFKGWRFSFGSKDDTDTDSNVYRENRASTVVFDNNWLVFRLSIAIILISLFILASVATHLPQRDDVARDAQADSPDLGPGRARSNITGYMPGVTPGLAIWIVFGLTKAFRQTMYERLLPKKWQRKGSESESLAHSLWTPSSGTPSTSKMSKPNLARIATDVEIQLDDLDQSMKKRASPDLTTTPLLANNPTLDQVWSVRSIK